MSESLGVHDQVGITVLRPLYLGLAADACLHSGRFDDGLSAVDEAIARAGTSGERFFEAELHRLRGEVLVAGWPERAEEAELSMRNAVAIADAQARCRFGTGQRPA